MIAVINTGVANIASVVAALKRLGRQAHVSDDADALQEASHVIFPGVGTAASAMTNMRQKNLDRVIPDLKQPVLGVCLGMQLLFEYSEEGDVKGLGVIEGRVEKMRPTQRCHTPHMGWNTLCRLQNDSPILAKIDHGAYAYFVHGYSVKTGPMTLASARHGADFSAVVQNGNFFGVQFHPERSGAVGAQLLQNFLAL